MEKTKYRIYLMYITCKTYVTTTRNCEDMITELLKMYPPDIYDYIKIVRVIGDREEVVFKKTAKKKNTLLNFRH